MSNILFLLCLQATKFRDCSQIPRSFVRQNVQLRGRLVDVDLAEGTLSVEHQPIISLPAPFWSRFQKNNNSNNSSQYLQLRLAFTSPTIAGIYWMRLNVNGAPIKFRLIDHHCGTSLEEDNKKRITLWAAVKVVQQQKQQKKQHQHSPTLNETLIRNGLAEVGGPFPRPNRTLLSKREAKLLHRLELAEAKAVQEGLGLWNDNATTTAASTGTALITVGQQVIRSWWTAIINTLRWALGWLGRTTTKTKEQ